MLEAVNSVLQSAPLVRGHSEQVSTTESFAANPDRVQKVAQAPYVSPYIAVDKTAHKIVLQIRDPDTGAVLQTFPSESDLKARVQDETQRAARTVRSSAPQEPSQSTQGRAPAPTAKQLAAFSSASKSGSGAGSQVTVLA